MCKALLNHRETALDKYVFILLLFKFVRAVPGTRPTNYIYIDICLVPSCELFVAQVPATK